MLYFKYIIVSVVIIPPIVIIIYTVIKHKIKGRKDEVEFKNDDKQLNNKNSSNTIINCSVLLLISGCFLANFKKLLPQVSNLIYFIRQGTTRNNQLPNEYFYSSGSDFTDSNSNYSD